MRREDLPPVELPPIDEAAGTDVVIDGAAADVVDVRLACGVHRASGNVVLDLGQEGARYLAMSPDLAREMAEALRRNADLAELHRD